MTRHPWGGCCRGTKVAKWQPLKTKEEKKRDCYLATAFFMRFELVRGGFDVLTSLAGALDDGCDEVDPVLREVVAVIPGGVAVDVVGVLQDKRMDDGAAARELGAGCLSVRFDFFRLRPDFRIPAAEFPV